MRNSDSSNNVRFSDEKLFEFHNEFREYTQLCEKRFNDGDSQFSQLLEAQHRNTEAINTLVEETRDVIKLHRDWQGAARIGNSLQKFATWLTKWGTIGIGLSVVFNWCLKELMELFK